ncbi:MAG: radical SAM protein [Candidatus Bathyarchaeia archaeon]
MDVFSPSKKSMCTCMPKYSLNTYLGRCQHDCIYCYSVKFPVFRGKAKPNLLLAENVELMVKNKKKKLPVMICSSTDPYQPLEEEYLITRKCIEVLARYNFPLMIFTKSHLVVRDLDVLTQTNALVEMTVTTINTEKQKKIEPRAPTLTKRLAALQKLSNEGVKTVARIDPVIPMLTDDEKELTTLVESLARTGVKHVTAATLRPVVGFFPRLKKVDPELHAKLRPLYMKGKLILGYRYLPEDHRKSIIAKVRRLTKDVGLTFGSCREGFSEWNTAACDGANYLWS